MSGILIAVILLTLLALVFGVLLGFAALKFKVEGNPIVDELEAILPQTQCGQCGYPGCRPYAEAIANGDKVNKCPPGGTATMEKLATLMGVEPEPLNAEAQSQVKKSPTFAKMNVLAALNVFKPALWMRLSVQESSCIPCLQPTARAAISALSLVLSIVLI